LPSGAAAVPAAPPPPASSQPGFGPLVSVSSPDITCTTPALDATAVALAELAGATAAILDTYIQMGEAASLSATTMSELEEKYDYYDKSAMSAYVDMKNLATSALANASSGAQEILDLVDKTYQLETSNDDLIAAISMLMEVAAVSAGILSRTVLTSAFVLSSLEEAGLYNTTTLDWQQMEE
ncbi:hypothetical protein VaNZ11_007843, partial [Volvox africanus]